MTEETQPRCSHCREVIGMYEPIVLVTDGARPQRTSRAAGPLPSSGIAMHEDCFRRSRPAQAD